jgi:hypothetical protein
MGNHTVNHPASDLSANGGKNLGSHLAEIDQCTDYIKQRFGQKEVLTFAAPYGDPGWIPYARQRFFVNRGVRSGNVGPLDDSDPFNLPVYPAKGGETAEPLIHELEAAREGGRWSIYMLHSILPGANWYAGVEMRYLGECLAHAAAQADLWTDTFAKVSAYWMGQKVFAAARVSAGAGIKTWAWDLPKHFPSGSYLRVQASGPLCQGGKPLSPYLLGGGPATYFEISLDAGSLSMAL